MKPTEKLFLVFVGTILLAANAEATRWISRDPMDIPEHMERDPFSIANSNPYTFVGNSPLNAIDPDGRDAYTLGPVTIPVPFTTPWWEAASQSAHEGQHRNDWWHGNYPGWQKEQRGYAAEIPVIQDQLKQYRNELASRRVRHCLDAKTEQKFQDAINGLDRDLTVAQGIANDNQQAIDYWNAAARRWYEARLRRQHRHSFSAYIIGDGQFRIKADQKMRKLCASCSSY